jgi:hypothetical protein
MSYTLPRTESRDSIFVDATSINHTTNLGFVGQGQTNYGEQTALNFLRLLENFSDEDEPSRPVTGQLWFDTSTTTLKINKNINDSQGGAIWQAVGGGDVTQPELDAVDDKIDNIIVSMGAFITPDGIFSDAFTSIFDNVAGETDLYGVLRDLDLAITAAAGGTPINIDDLLDVDTTGKVDTYVLTYDSGVWKALPPPAGGGGGAGEFWGADTPGAIESVVAFAADWDQNYLVNTTSNTVDVILPAGAPGNVGHTIGFVDVAGAFGQPHVFSVTTDTVSDKIMGTTELGGGEATMIVSTQFASLRVVWAGPTYGWRLVT